jgi:hypothetical protein
MDTLFPRQRGLRVAVVRTEKAMDETGNNSGTLRKRNVRRWKLPSNGY